MLVRRAINTSTQVCRSGGFLQVQPQSNIVHKRRREDLHSNYSVRKSNKTPFRPRNSPLDKHRALYPRKYPVLGFTKHYHRELEILKETDDINGMLSRFWFLYRIGKHPTTHTIELLAEGCTRTGKTDEVPKLIDLVTKRGFELPTPETWKYLASGYLLEGRDAEAEKAFATLRSKYEGFESDLKLYNGRLAGVYLNRAFDSNNSSEVSRWLDTLHSLEFSNNDWCEMIDQLSDKFIAGHSEALLSVLTKFLGEQNGYDLLIYSLAKRGSYESVNNYIAQLKSKNLEVNEEIYDSLIHAYTKSDKLTEALEVLEQLKQANLQACLTSFEDIIRLAIKLNNVEVVENLLVQLTAVGVVPRQPTTLIDLAKHFAKSDARKAKQFWFYAQDVDAIFDSQFNHEVISALAKSGHHADALDIFHRIKENHVMPLEETYFSLIESSRKLELTEQASSLDRERLRSFH